MLLQCLEVCLIITRTCRQGSSAFICEVNRKQKAKIDAIVNFFHKIKQAKGLVLNVPHVRSSFDFIVQNIFLLYMKH